MALGHIGHSKLIADLDTENSQESSQCRLFYDQCRDMLINDFPWSFSTRIAYLSLVEESPNDEWEYSYRYPSDCLNIRRVLSGLRTDTRDSVIPFKLSSDDSGSLIFCDVENAQIEYSTNIDNPELYPPFFVMAFSYLLATFISPTITGGDKFKLGERAAKFYSFYIKKAQAQDANEEQADQAPESEYIRAMY